MMATLVSKVQLLRDLRALQAEAKAEEAKKQESLLQSSSKVTIEGQGEKGGGWRRGAVELIKSLRSKSIFGGIQVHQR